MALQKNIEPGEIPDNLKEDSENFSDAAFYGTKGVGGTVIIEAHPEFLKLDNEKLIDNNNARIVLGRDRPSHRYSGHGGNGDTQADSIDIVVGGVSTIKKSVDDTGKKLYADPNFVLDAARIHISQRTDIDDNFGLVDGSIGNSKDRSGIAIKADNIRFIAREGIKIVTGVDRLNSQGGRNSKLYGIDLIAGNNDKELQPIVKGENLVSAIEELVKNIDNLNGIVDSILMAQMAMNEALTNHFHNSPFFGMATTPSTTVQAAGIKCMMDHLTNAKRSLINHKVNLVNYKQKYLYQSGNVYINSRYNNTN